MSSQESHWPAAAQHGTKQAKPDAVVLKAVEWWSHTQSGGHAQHYMPAREHLTLIPSFRVLSTRVSTQGEAGLGEAKSFVREKSSNDFTPAVSHGTEAVGRRLSIGLGGQHMAVTRPLAGVPGKGSKQLERAGVLGEGGLTQRGNEDKLTAAGKINRLGVD